MTYSENTPRNPLEIPPVKTGKETFNGLRLLTTVFLILCGISSIGFGMLLATGGMSLFNLGGQYFLVAGLVYIAMAVTTLIGATCVYYHKNYSLALAGAITGVISSLILWPILLISIPATILIIKKRNDFFINREHYERTQEN